jgi:small-conductance mechanosensitive channel
MRSPLASLLRRLQLARAKTVLPAALAIALLAAGGAPAQQSGDRTAGPPDPTSAQALKQRKDEVQREIAELRDRRAATDSQEAASTNADAKLEILRSIDSLLARSIEERRALETASEPAPPRSPSPATIGALISLYEEIDQDRARLQDLARAVDAAREASETAASALDDAERARREARQAADEEPSADASARLELAKLRSRAAQEEVYLRELELRSDRAVHQSLEDRIQTLQAQAQAAVQELRNADHPEEQDTDLVRREGELARRQEEAQRTLDTAELRLRNASSRYASQASPSPHELEEVEALQLARDAAAQAVATLKKQAERIESERQLRSRWLRLLRDGLPSSTVAEWASEARAQADEYQRTILQRQGRLADLKERTDELKRRLAEATDPALHAALEHRQTATEHLTQLLTEDVADLGRHERIQRRLIDVLQDESGSVPLRERMSAIWGAVRDLWRYEVTSIDDKPITVGNGILALLLFALGFSVSRRLSLALRRVLDARLRLEPGVAGAAQTAVFYVLLVSFGLIALRTINFPLTAFTVAGGALAIGVGFGSQNVMNNFISGLILMLERPVRANDLIEVENTHGVIEQIGARSTRIRATDGRHLIVPNSFFLENNVVNWTLSDDLIRSKVTVGVIYGSPTRLVEKLIRRALDENPKVLSTPQPIIVFSEFGDNSLNFDAYFWTRARGPMAVYQLGGEVRFRIDDLFREHDLVIAFPQRDVHLDSVSPIEIRLLGGEAGERGDAPDDPEER